MTQSVVIKPQNPVTPVSQDSDGNAIVDRAGQSPVPIKGAIFTPGSYDADLTMNGTGQSGALATGTTAVLFTNTGATAKYIRVAFGTSSADAINNLTVVAAAATTGLVIPSPADDFGSIILGAPVNATHYAVANGVAADTQVVHVTQGV